MRILISTLPFVEGEFTDVFKVLEQVKATQNVGIEIFPVFKSHQFNETIEKHIDQINRYVTTLHGPYFDIEHSAPKGTEAYELAIEEFKRVIELGETTAASHIVFHYNNKVITTENKLDTILTARKNLAELNQLVEHTGIKILFENTGVNVRENNLFTEAEFIEEALRISNDVLFDVGHANANGWDIANVIKMLQDKIKVYHLNNNFSQDDDHNRILEGDIDYVALAALYHHYTPDADLVLEYGDNVATDLAGIAQDVEYLQTHFSH